MKKNISRILGFVIIAAAFLSACLPQIAQNPQNPTDKNVLYTPTVSNSGENATALPVVIQPTPTSYDARATELVIADLEAQAQKARDEKALLEAKTTQEYADTQNQIALNQAEIEKAESNARISVAYANQSVDEKVKLAEQERLLIEAEALKKQADIDAALAMAGVVVLYAIATGIVIICIAAGVRIIRTAQSVDYQESGDSIPASNQPIFDDNALAKPEPTYTHGVTRSILDNYPCTDAAFKVWALAMLAGGAAGENKWTDAGSPFTTKSYPIFLRWAEVDKQFIEVAPGKAKTLNPAGISYCTDWCERRGIPVPERERTE